MKKVRKEKRIKSKKEKVIKAPRIQTIFCLISILFIITCCIFYGNRLIKYYRVYNPKSDTGYVLANLSSKITSESSIVYEGDGLYISNGNYIYKGLDVDNYILVSNMLFRIVKINSDKTIDIVLDDYINKLSFNDEVSSYLDSSLNTYLVDNFLSVIDNSLLNTTSICTDTISELSEISCNSVNSDNYIRLLGINDFLNSMNDSKTYLVNSDEYLWLYNNSDNNIWHTKGNNISLSNSSSLYAVKPVLTLKNTTVYKTGDGSIDNPYQISEESNIGVGTYLDIDDDIYIVYEVGEDYYKVQSNNLLSKTYYFDSTSNSYSSSSLKTYLENDYLKSLSYQDLLKEVEFSSYKSKVGILSNNDLKFNSSLKSYFLSDTKDKKVYLYNSSVLTTNVNAKRSVRPCLGITKELNIISGNGSKLAPFIVEV